MTSKETRAAVFDIHAAIHTLEKRFLINRAIYIFTLICVVLIAFFTWKLWGITITTLNLATANSIENQKHEVRLDADREQYISYIETVARIIDRLQQQNPQIKVPKSDVLFKPPGSAMGDGDFDRPKYEHPKADLPSPTPVTKTVTKYRHPKATPTPKPWFKFFKDTR